MSKKLHSTPRWKRRIAHAQKREAKKCRRRSRNRSGSLTADSLKRNPFRTLKPPSVLSLIDNPSETVGFLRRLEREIPRSRVFIDFEDVSVITPDAPLALLGTLEKYPKGGVRGSLPASLEARAIIEQSGFFEHVQHRIALKADCQGVMMKHAGNQVDGHLARELVLRGTELLYGTPSDSEPSYGIILEGMENTVAHGHQPQGFRRSLVYEKERWWASVYVDRQRNRICFAVLDLGIGILRSARVKTWRRLDLLLRKAADGEVLMELLAGKLPSHTGLPNRGKGLPSIRRLSDAGEIKNCTIIANSASVRLSTGEVNVMPEEFRGTLLYWEI